MGLVVHPTGVCARVAWRRRAPTTRINVAVGTRFTYGCNARARVKGPVSRACGQHKTSSRVNALLRVSIVTLQHGVGDVASAVA